MDFDENIENIEGEGEEGEGGNLDDIFAGGEEGVVRILSFPNHKLFIGWQRFLQITERCCYICR